MNINSEEEDAQELGDEYIINTLGIWDNYEDIDFDKLPNQFVLKCTHNSGGLVICKNKAELNIKTAKKIINKSLKKNYYYNGREWPYKNVKRRIIAEQYMEDRDSEDLIDYKFYCFNGEPIYCQVIRDRRSTETIDFYDKDWKHMPFVGLNPIVKNGITQVVKPYNLEDMLSICRKVASQIPFVRVDLYSIQRKVYMGEITFYPASGMGVFTPQEWNYKLGELISSIYSGRI